MVSKGGKAQTRKTEGAIIPSFLISDFNKVINNDINHYVEGTKVVTSIVLTKELLEAYNTIPELSNQLSKRIRFLLAQDLITNGWGDDLVEEKLKLIHNMKRDLENCEVILNEHLAKKREELLAESRKKAQEIEKEDQLVEFLRNESKEYKNLFRQRLLRESRETAIKQVLEIIEAQLKVKIKTAFEQEMNSEKLFTIMGLENVK